MEAYVKHELVNNIATIEFFHPEQNSLPGHILAQLAQTISLATILPPEPKNLDFSSGAHGVFEQTSTYP